MPLFSRPFQKRALQLAVSLCAIVPVAAGFAGILAGPGMVPDVSASPVPLDSHFRYLSGLLLGIGFAFWSTVPRIERRGGRFRVLTGIVVVGGLGRLVSLASVGVPDGPMLFGLAMELVVTPLLALWQYRLARHMRKAAKD